MHANHMVEYFKATNKANKLLDKRFVILQSWQMFLSGTAYKGNFQTSFFKHLELRRDGQFYIPSLMSIPAHSFMDIPV